MSRLVRTRLSAMMFLFYSGLGAWAVTAGTYLISSPLKGGLNFTTTEVGWIYSTFAIGGMLSHPFVGILADRLFRAERILVVSGIGCAVFLFAAGWWCQLNEPTIDRVYREVASEQIVFGKPVLEIYAQHRPGHQPEQVVEAFDKVNDDPRMRAECNKVFRVLFVIMLAQAICIQVAMPLCTVITLRNLPDPSGQFSRTRMFGTIGWIIVGMSMGLFLNPVSAEPFFLASLLTIVHTVHSLLLPTTPPRSSGRTLAESLGLPAFGLLKDRSFVVLLLVTLLLSQMNQMYGVYGHRFLTDKGVSQPERWMTLGQSAEVICMFVIPLMRPKETMKWLMLLGLLGGVVRGAALAWGPQWLVLGLGVPMHGLSYAFYFVVASMFIDREAPPHLRASAQAIIAFVTSGVGQWTGNLMAAEIVDHYRTGTIIDWPSVWEFPLIGCVIALALLVVGFRTTNGSSAVKYSSS